MGSVYIVTLALCVAVSLPAQDKSTKLRGTVQDSDTRKPIGGATVSAVGDAVRASQVTDDNGFFQLVTAGIGPGELVRLRVEKTGYAVYDSQVIASEELPLQLSLKRLYVPPHVTPRPPAPEPAAPANTVNAHFIAQLKTDPDPLVRLNALNVLVSAAPSDRTAVAGIVGAILDNDVRVRKAAIDAAGKLHPDSKEVVTNLLISLHDKEEPVRQAATAALGKFPDSKDCMDALFGRLGSPPRINTVAMKTLIGMGIDDPRLTDALIYRVTRNDGDASAALLKRSPLGAPVVKQLLDELVKSLDSPINYEQQSILNLLLNAGGNPARQSLHDLFKTMDAYHQSRLALCWLEIDHGSRAEILQVANVPAVTDELTKAMEKSQPETVFLPEFREWSSVLYHFDRKCNLGGTMRAAMGVLVLDLAGPAKEKAWTLLNGMIVSYGDLCSIYAAEVPAWLNPAVAQRAIPFLAATLQCARNLQVPQGLADDVLSKIGDESTIALLQRLSAQRTEICGNEDDDPLGKPHLNALIARIRNRPHN
jgi:HEAT repeat protein